MPVSDDEYHRVRALKDEYAEKIVRLTSLVNEMREVIRLARRVVEAADPDELFLEELRDALADVAEV